MLRGIEVAAYVVLVGGWERNTNRFTNQGLLEAGRSFCVGLICSRVLVISVVVCPFDGLPLF